MIEPREGPNDRTDVPVDMEILPRVRDLGGFEVHRVLPSPRRQMVGPFIFIDQMGPACLAPGKGIDVRPHPHIGLATITYLFEGEILHRDNLGNEQAIRPGEVNWMTAGRGIAHSERTPQARRAQSEQVFGLQTWVALPSASEETAAAFVHYGENQLPRFEDSAMTVRLIVGRLYGRRSPVNALSDTIYADAMLRAGARMPFDADYEERAIYVVSGDIDIGGTPFGAGRLLVVRPGAQPTITARTTARFMLLGGATLDGQRYIWWNFVSSRKERIREAAADWKAGRFAKIPGDTVEYTPLPDTMSLTPSS